MNKDEDCICFYRDAVKPSGRAAAGQKKERSGLQSACDELIDKGAFITGE